MSSFTVTMMAGSPPPVTDSNGSNPKWAAATSLKRSTIPLQVGVKQFQKLETFENKSMNISRRDLALFLTAASFSAVNLSSPKPAEASISTSEIKKIILEKFRILREKIGLSKQETEENKEIASSSSSPSEADEKSSPPATSAPSIGKEKTAVISPPAKSALSIGKEKTAVPQELPLPNIQNDKKTVVEAATLP